MKKVSFFIMIIIFLLIGCSQEYKTTASPPLEKEYSNIIKHIDLIDPNEIAIFSTAVNDSTRVPGIVNVAHPEYEFSIDGERYFLWLVEDSGAIMNLKDSHTLYTLSKTSVEKVYEYVSQNL